MWRVRRGREFTREDEETLVMFASQAALVIANARRYQDEQRTRADLEALISTSPMGVVVFDARTGDVVSFNRETARILEYLRIPDRPIEHLLEVASVTRADGRRFSLDEFPVAEVLATGEAVHAEEIVIGVPDGRRVTTLINSTPIYSEEGGELRSVVVTIQDMTQLEELERQRAEFLGMVSHELRTPLSTIKGSTATLLEASPEMDPAEVRQFHRIIYAQADRMRELISDLLDVAHIETGTLSVNPESSEVAALVDQARNGFLSGGGGLDVHIDIPIDLPPVMADRRRIVQVLTNLLANAARHSQGSAPSQVTAAVDDHYVAVSVADDGRGMSAQRLRHLFGRFPRVAQGGDRAIDGSGLGLAICKGIVEAHGGRIRAESDGPGLGTRFTFTLPVTDRVRPGETADPDGSRVHSQRPTGEQTRILVVDDDPLALRHIREVLTGAGYAPTVAADPEGALRLVQEVQPDLALLDLVLPDMDGIELMQRISEISDVPVIFVSAYGRDENIERAFEMGAADYMVKPFSPTELVARITAALRKHAGRDRPEPGEPFRLGDLTTDYAQRRVHVANRTVHLTPIEYGLLRTLSVSAGRVVTHAQLLQQVWGPRNSGDPQLVRTHVRRLRRKLGDDANNPSYIFTEPGVGYRIPGGEEPRPETP